MINPNDLTKGDIGGDVTQSPCKISLSLTTRTPYLSITYIKKNILVCLMYKITYVLLV